MLAGADALEHEILPPESGMEALRLLVKHGPVTASELAPRGKWNQSPTAWSNRLDALERDGWVKSERQSRRRVFEATAHGRDLIARMK